MENKNEEKIFTVSEFIDSLNEILVAQKVVIQGEIGEKIDCYPRYSFFNLLDKNKDAILKCFVWQNRLKDLGINLEPGMEVKVSGYPEIFKKRGSLTLQVEKMGLVGEGPLKRAFELLKKKLSEAGLFDLAKKKAVPSFCQRIGVITSMYGKGAWPDFSRHLGDFGFEIYFYDVRVEGLLSIDEIIEAIRWFNENLVDIDVLVLIRGGGNYESLQSFNSELVAKAIFASKIPIICGVGHESDETIADLVADRRVSTPSIAARILSEPWELANSQIPYFNKNIVSSVIKIYKNIYKNINIFENLIKLEMENKIKGNEKRLRNLVKDLNLYFLGYFEKFNRLEIKFLSNLRLLRSFVKAIKFKVKQLPVNLNKFFYGWFKNLETLVINEEEKLNMANPEQRLKQGYTITFDEFSGKIIKDIKQLKIGKNLRTKLHKGCISSKVEKISEK